MAAGEVDSTAVVEAEAAFTEVEAALSTAAAAADIPTAAVPHVPQRHAAETLAVAITTQARPTIFRPLRTVRSPTIQTLVAP